MDIFKEINWVTMGFFMTGEGISSICLHDADKNYVFIFLSRSTMVTTSNLVIIS